MNERHTDAIATQKEVQEFFTSVLRGEVKEEVVSNNGKILEVPASTKDRLKAAECMGRAYGMFTERKEISGTMDINIGVGDYDEDEQRAAETNTPVVKTKEGDAMPNINLNFPKPNKVFNKQIFDNLFDYSHFIEVWY